MRSLHNIGAKQQDIEESYLNDLLHAKINNQSLNSIHEVEVIQLTNDSMNEPDEDQLMMDVLEAESADINIVGAENNQDEIVVIEEQEGTCSLECQIVKVNGKRLALPLASIANIIPCPDKVWLDADKHNCVIGLMPYEDMAVDVVPISFLMNPDGREDTTLESIKDKGDTIVILKDSEIGLACDEAAETILLNKESICWRGEESKRKWLAGTIKEEDLALLDTEEIIVMIAGREDGRG